MDSTQSEIEKLGRHCLQIQVDLSYVVTDNTLALRDDPVRYQAILERIPAGRWGEPEELEGVVVFLASRASSYLHGCIIVLDSGWLAR